MFKCLTDVKKSKIFRKESENFLITCKTTSSLFTDFLKQVLESNQTCQKFAECHVFFFTSEVPVLLVGPQMNKPAVAKIKSYFC